ncbi:unnamed protein product [Ambrosiozyma monospora]|uniref:Unnamed protein product n=1 Tax=Ambrosiozyma monospora TaxID=43982 RepID=A0ACB5UDT5_AMBMO|nr:unnamed protein product [Ambrosiozyma monospora]
MDNNIKNNFEPNKYCSIHSKPVKHYITMVKPPDVKRRKTATRTSRLSTADTYTWIRNKNDLKPYSIINELPTEV